MVLKEIKDVKLSRSLGIKKGMVLGVNIDIEDENTKDLILNSVTIVNEEYQLINNFMNNREVQLSSLNIKDEEQLATLYNEKDIGDEVLIDNLDKLNLMEVSFIKRGIINIKCTEIDNRIIRFDTGINDILFIIKDKWLFIYIKSLKSFKVYNMETKYHTIFTDPSNEDKYDNLVNCYGSLVVKLLLEFNRLNQLSKETIACNRKVIGKNKKNNKPITSNNYSINISNNKIYDYGKNYKPQKKYERHTESWEVRGFWRTYKSGKKVWIKPSVRGNKKVKPKNQAYSI